VFEPAGYSLGKQLVSSSQTEIVAATRDTDGKPVVLKCYIDDELPDGSSRAMREFESLRAGAGPSIVGALELLTEFTPPILVLEHLAGIGLDEWVIAALPSELDFLEVSIALAGALSRVHAARLIHRDINPTNVMVDPTRAENTHLIDFGTTHALGMASRGGLAPTSRAARMGAALAYIAPEQSGRMGRGIDSRSDLYSLGATLYFTLTGRPPFDTRDPLALVHAHMARLPQDPIELRSNVSPVIGRILLKLLEKEPELRYQTATALRVDLETCRTRLTENGRVEIFDLAQADMRSHPVFPRKLFGRDSELASLRAGFERASSGAVEVVLLCGASGVGKTAMVEELRRSIADSGGYLCVGKFDAYGEQTPYAGFIDAFESFVHQMLCESDSRIELWRAQLRESLGTLAGVMTGLVPDLSLLLGQVEPVPPLGPREARARLAYALQRFMDGCTAPGRPLVLFLDDLHRADRASLWLLEELLAGQRSSGSLLVIGALRERGDERSDTLREMFGRLAERRLPITTLELGPLRADMVGELLAEVFVRRLQDVSALATAVTRKTDGNPLLIQELVLQMHAEGRIRFVPPDGWHWDDDAVRSAEIPEGAVGMMVAKLQRLEPKLLGLVQQISCVAEEFDVSTLAERCGEAASELEPMLFSLSDQGLLLPSRLGFRWAHGRVREAAQATLGSHERASIHYQIGKRLLALAPVERSSRLALEIADHFRHGQACIVEADHHEVVQAYVRAGEHALATGAITTANEYLARGRDLFRDADFESHGSQGFALLYQSAEVATQLQESELALALLDRLEAQPLAPMQLAQTIAKRVRVVTRIDPKQAVEIALAGIRRFGSSLPSHPSRLRIRLLMSYTDWCLRGPLDDRKFGPLDPSDLSWIPPIYVLSEAGIAMLRTRGNLVAISIMQGLRAFARHGAPRSPALSLAAYAAMRPEYLGHCRGVERYARAAEEWIQRAPLDPMNVRAEGSLTIFSLAWCVARRSLVQRMDQVSKKLQELGDLEYAGRTIQLRTTCLALTGEPLPAVAHEVELLQRWDQWPEVKAWIELYPLSYGLLESTSTDPIDWLTAGERTRTMLRGEILNMRIHWIVTLCLFGQFEQAEPELQAASDMQVMRVPHAAPDYRFFQGVCAAGLAHGATGGVRRRHLRELRKPLRWLQRLRAATPDWEHMILFLRAELTLLRRRFDEASRLFSQSAAVAHARGFRHHAALAHERCAASLRALHRFSEAEQATERAVALYREWGAHAKVHQLQSANG